MNSWKPVLTVIMVALAMSSARAQTQPSPVPAAATALAMRSLRSIDHSWVVAPTGKGASDCVMVGRERGGSGDWRVLVLTGGDRPKVTWDSQRLSMGGYFRGPKSDVITVRNDQEEGYLITIRGCAPRRCYDGLFGYAVYVSKLRRAFTAQVSTLLLNRNAFHYTVTYNPPESVPAEYRSALDRMICAEPGISEPAKLPIKCPGR
jgi:hypothetical protein